MSTEAEEMREVGPWGQAVALTARVLLFGAVATAVGWSVSNTRQVSPDSQAIVVRFGTVARIRGPGLLLAWPKPIERVTLIPAAARQIQFPISRFTENGESTPDTASAGFAVDDNPRGNTAFLLSGDSSIVHLETQLFYQIHDAAAYMIAADHVGPALERLFIASAVDVIAARDLDTVLVARPEIASRNSEAMSRERLRIDLMNAANRRLAQLAEQGAGLGIVISRVDLVPSIPQGAKIAFDSVLTTTQAAEQGIANARTSAQIMLGQANQARDRVVTDATAASEETLSNATVATASIAALAKSGRGMSHGMLLSRLYFDRIGPILKKAGRVELTDRAGTTRLLLPGTP